MVVGSLAVSLLVFVSPPPATLAVLVTLVGAAGSTATVNVKDRKLAALANASLRVAVIVWPLDDTVQPLMTPLSAPVGARPVGSTSVTVTVPEDAAVPKFETVIL